MKANLLKVEDDMIKLVGGLSLEKYAFIDNSLITGHIENRVSVKVFVGFYNKIRRNLRLGKQVTST